ncbi:MAG TPA: hypothetical protein VF131_23270 [Blastocatellia bacterium]|nr:hypothetical protein [Blastocatellia bacterium]
MRNKRLLIAFLAAAMLIGASSLSRVRAQDPLPDAATHLPGTWAINFVAPEVSPKGNRFDQPHRHRFSFSDTDGQRITLAREVFELRVPGAWRTSGHEFSATFEFVCDPGLTCGSIIMRGRLEDEHNMNGRIIIIYDTLDSSTPTGRDTVAGTFRGEKCNDRTGGITPQHDTGGCE